MSSRLMAPGLGNPYGYNGLNGYSGYRFGSYLPSKLLWSKGRNFWLIYVFVRIILIWISEKSLNLIFKILKILSFIWI